METKPLSEVLDDYKNKCVFCKKETHPDANITDKETLNNLHLCIECFSKAKGRSYVECASCQALLDLNSEDLINTTCQICNKEAK